MGAVGGLLGMNGGAGGTGFSTTPGTSGQQLNSAYTGAQNAMNEQQALLSALQGQNGLGNQSNVYNQLQGVVAGQGPNPAQAMLNQATGANVANQAALAAGQRGAGANVGLMARQAAQTGAGLQQQAAGQGASMQAQQSLGALGQAGQLANTQAANQIGATGALSQARQNEQSILQGANTAHNQIQGQLANTTMQGQQGMIGGLMNAAGAGAGLIGGKSGLTTLMGAEGGQVPNVNGPQSMFGQSLMQNPMMAQGGTVPAMVSPGEVFLNPKEAQAVHDGKVHPMQVGEKIPGQAKVKGDSYQNDTVRRDLEVGGIVLPRHVTQNKNPGKEAKAFVDAYMAKKRRKV